MTDPRSLKCAECGAPLATGQQRCWLCQRKAAPSEAENPYAPPRPIAGEHSAAQFSLASLFLVMTLVAVGLGVFMLAPGLGILFGMVATPALIRTMFATTLYKQAGTPLTAIEKVESFIISLFVMAAVGLASSVAFLVVCFAGAALVGAGRGPMEAILGVGIIGGLFAAVPLAIYLIRLTRPGKLM